MHKFAGVARETSLRYTWLREMVSDLLADIVTSVEDGDGVFDLAI